MWFHLFSHYILSNCLFPPISFTPAHPAKTPRAAHSVSMKRVLSRKIPRKIHASVLADANTCSFPPPPSGSNIRHASQRFMVQWLTATHSLRLRTPKTASNCVLRDFNEQKTPHPHRQQQTQQRNRVQNTYSSPLYTPRTSASFLEDPLALLGHFPV